MASRSRAAEAWAEADRIEALALHEGVLDALKKIGWIVDADDSISGTGNELRFMSRSPSLIGFGNSYPVPEIEGITRWVLWARDANELKSIVAGPPLGMNASICLK